jgi:NAD dependent epimerase/dehydratase family enzyme
VLAGSLNRPAIFRVPSAILHAIGGQLADELLLGGQRVVPAKAIASGFAFRHETLRDAPDAVLGSAKTGTVIPRNAGRYLQ